MFTDADWVRLAPIIARDIGKYRKLNVKLSTATEKRFGAKGSLSIDLKKGTYFDHELNEGGGMLKLLRKFGIDPEFYFPERRQGNGKGRPGIECTYDYVDESGALLSQAVRMEPGAHQRFFQRAPDGKGGWINNIKGVRRVPFHLPQLIAAVAGRRVVFVVEGEKDVLTLEANGYAATTNAEGAGKWRAEFAAFMIGADVVVIPDNDEPGRKHAGEVIASLKGKARRVRLLELPGLDDKGDASDWFAEAGNTAAVFDGLGAGARVVWEAKQKFRLIPFADLRLKSDPLYVVKHLVPARGLTLIWGPPKCGKSFFAFDLAMHVVNGWQFLGRKVMRGAVVYCAFEGASGFNLRADAFRLRHVDRDEAAPFYLMDTPTNLIEDHAALIEEIAQQLGESKPIVIVLDTLNRSLAGSENDTETMGGYVRAADALRERFGAAVIVVHHCGVDEKRPRGHTSLAGAVDAMIAVARTASGNLAQVQRMKDGPEEGRIAFRLDVLEIGRDEDNEPITSCVVAPAPPGETSTAGKKKLPASMEVAMRALHAALAAEGTNPPVGYPVNSKVVQEPTWKRYAMDMGISGGNPEAGEKAFRRAFNYLLSQRVIVFWQGWVAVP